MANNGIKKSDHYWETTFVASFCKPSVPSPVIKH